MIGMSKRIKAPRCLTRSDVTINLRVVLVKGQYEGMAGVVTRLTAKNVDVEIDAVGAGPSKVVNTPPTVLMKNSDEDEDISSAVSHSTNGTREYPAEEGNSIATVPEESPATDGFLFRELFFNLHLLECVEDMDELHLPTKMKYHLKVFAKELKKNWVDNDSVIPQLLVKMALKEIEKDNKN